MNERMIEEIIAGKTALALKELYGSAPEPKDISIEKTKKELEGDFTVIVFPLTRFSKKPPEVTGSEIAAVLSKEIAEISEIKVIKGFLNITLEEKFWTDFIDEHYSETGFGVPGPKDPAPVLIEFSSPNTNKPLHLGHIRNNLLGCSLAKILDANGYKVVKLNLVNDRGIHICKSMLAFSRWGDGETPGSSGIKGDHLIGKYYVLFDQKYKEEIVRLVSNGMDQEEAEKQAPLIREAQDMLVRWEAGDPDVRELWNRMNQWAYEGFDETYKRLGISFDHIEYESQNYLKGKDLVLKGLEEGHLTRKEDGSIWADLTDMGLDEKLLLRSDGTSVYMTQDLGTAELRYRQYKPSEMIYVVGNEQIYHFDVLKLVLKKLGYKWADLIFHLSYGMVELPEGKMKSREGTVVDADDLMDEMFMTAEKTTRELGKTGDLPEKEAVDLYRMIGLGALKYFILKVDPKKNMLFDPQESIDFNGNTGPFIQYTHARIRSLLKKGEDAGYNPNSGEKTENISLLPVEKRIIKLIHIFPEILRQAGEQLSPALIANYVYELAKEYNQFYQEIPVLKAEDRSLILFRLKFSLFTGIIIRRSMSLLGIEVPEKM